MHSIQNQLELISTANKASSDMVKNNPNYADVQVYYNGPAEDVPKFKTENPPPECVNFTSIEKECFPPIVHDYPELISLVWWFRHGWNTVSSEQVVLLLNEFTHLKYLCSDITPAKLTSMGFDFDKHQLIKVRKVNGRMVGQNSQRTFHVYFFDSALPAIPDGIWQPTSEEYLKRALEYLNKYMVCQKKDRAAKHQVRSGIYVPECFRSSGKKRPTKSTTTTTTSSYSKKMAFEITEDEANHFEQILFPVHCTTMASKLSYIKTNKGKLMYLDNKAHQSTDDLLVTRFNSIKFEDQVRDEESIVSVSTLEKIEKIRQLVDRGAPKEELLELIASIQLNVRTICI